MNRSLLWFLLAFLGCLSLSAPLWADSIERGEREGFMEMFFEEAPHEGHREKEEISERHIKPITNQVYLSECGACHFAYQAELLPSQSWERVLAHLEDHFGDDAVLDAANLAQVRGYLLGNAAETSSSGRAQKLVRSIQGEAPMRITELPYFRHEHNEVSATVIARPAIKSLSNCVACHQRAAAGVYSEDYVRIPQ
ncbi:MAG: diheme cytochrome c [bacterium]|nr:diheme cytochrome c [bacterium]